MKANNTLTIFITPVKGEEIRIEKVCTLKQAATLAKKEARKMINNGGIFVTINIIIRASYGVETLAHIEAEKEGRRVVFSDDQPAADEEPRTEPAEDVTEFSELSHAGQCLDIYLHNTSEIYNRYTVPAIAAVVEAVKRNGWQLPKDEAIKNLIFWTSWQPGTKKALQAAARLVRKCDRLTPTAQDIEQVTRNYAAYIVDCAKQEIEKGSEPAVTVEIENNECGCTASVNGVKIGWVCGWLNNTFAGCLVIGLRVLRDLAPLDLHTAQESHHGFTDRENAALWLGDTAKAYFKEMGMAAKVVNL